MIDLGTGELLMEQRIGWAGSAAAISAGIVLAAGLVALAFLELGPLSLQMVLHLAVMNVVAPLIALGLARRLPPSAGLLWIAGLSQMLLLWAWHAPSLQQDLAAMPGPHAALLVLLGVSAVLFWAVLIRAAAAGGWRALAALLLTGKLACLLGALLIFAPRDLYGLPGLVLAFCTTGPSTLEDQQLAGLLMITACPLSYLVAGVVLAAQMVLRLETEGEGDGVIAFR
jgi:putative membrane protein